MYTIFPTYLKIRYQLFLFFRKNRGVGDFYIKIRSIWHETRQNRQFIPNLN